MNSSNTTEVAPPVRHRVSTSEVASKDRTSYWLDMICSLYTKLECDSPAGGIVGEIEFSRLGALDFTEVRSNVNRMRRTPSMIQRDNRESCLVMIQRLGQSLVAQDGREAWLAPGDFVMYDTTRPYELHFDDPYHEIIVLRVQTSELQSHLVNFEDLTATTVSGTGAAGNLLLTMLDTLQRDIDRLHPSSAYGVSEAITSIIAAGLRSLPGANLRQPTQLGAYHVERVKAFAMKELRNPQLSVASIAAAMQISPDHLSRIFRDEPLPLSRWIWQQRLDACRRDLSDISQVKQSVSHIAFKWGFNDASHFSRLFKEHCGMSPRVWREQAATAWQSK